MATTSFTIYSRYDPEKGKERLQRETGQTLLEGDNLESDDEQAWREAASAKFLRAQRPPPKFVPAAISYEVGSGEQGSSKPLQKSSEEPLSGSSLSSWYRSLIGGDSTSTHQPRPSSAPIPTTSTGDAQERKKGYRAPQIKDKNNWFIQKVLQFEPPTTPSTPPPTLADILAREPPPLPSEPKYTPPVWIEIGPSNKGFAMLQKGGWNEGEALGLGARRRPLSSTGAGGSVITSKGKEKAVVMEPPENRPSRVDKQELCDNLGDVKDGADIIDLTQSDSESSSEEEEVEGDMAEEIPQGSELPLLEGDAEDISAHGRKALLTPIATVLKLDRLGIGLKAKTEGPYKASVKRVTHNAASLAAHARAAEEARRRRDKFGRGRRGYERQRRTEEDKRRDLIAYMNS